MTLLITEDRELVKVSQIQIIMVENLYEMNVSSGDGLNISDKFQNSTDTRIPGENIFLKKKSLILVEKDQTPPPTPNLNDCGPNFMIISCQEYG